MLWSMVLVLTWPMLYQRSLFIPLSIISLGDFMSKKIISSLTTLLAALLLVSCAPSHSTNNQPTASSTEVTKKNEISITVSVTPEGQEAQSKTLKVAEDSNLMKVLKANYKIEEKMA